MEKSELETLIKEYNDGFITFNELVYLVGEDNENIHRRDYLKDIVIEEIKSDNLYRARHILDAMDKEWADYYLYDLCMGTLETPMAITSVDDLYDCIEY